MMLFEAAIDRGASCKANPFTPTYSVLRLPVLQAQLAKLVMAAGGTSILDEMLQKMATEGRLQQDVFLEVQIVKRLQHRRRMCNVAVLMM